MHDLLKWSTLSLFLSLSLSLIAIIITIITWTLKNEEMVLLFYYSSANSELGFCNKQAFSTKW